MSVFLHRVGLLKPLAAAPSGYSFTMTAADIAGVVEGYSNGSSIPAGGSIDAEPITGETLNHLVTGFEAFNVISFEGDLVSLLTGLTVWVDSVEYPFDGQDWTFDGTDTNAGWTLANAPVFVDTNMYFVEIK